MAVHGARRYVICGDLRLREDWELPVGDRLLDMSGLDEQRSGALAAISRYIGDHLKVGVGYNFTDVSDDLTDLSYDHHGFFLNVTGSM